MTVFMGHDTTWPFEERVKGQYFAGIQYSEAHDGTWVHFWVWHEANVHDALSVAKRQRRVEYYSWDYIPLPEEFKE